MFASAPISKLAVADATVFCEFKFKSKSTLQTKIFFKTSFKVNLFVFKKSFFFCQLVFSKSDFCVTEHSLRHICFFKKRQIFQNPDK